MHADPQIVKHVLALLRDWGWETGVEKLQAEIEATNDIDRRAALHLFVGWMAWERGAHAVALEQFKAVAHLPALVGWAGVGQAFVALHQSEYTHVYALLDQAAAQADANDTVLHATIAHCRGVALYHEGQFDLALRHLHTALETLGMEHFGTGRVLDSLGMVYTSKDNLHAAREFYEKAIESKQRFEDEGGIALSHGQLGRLYLDWGNVEKAHEHLQQDLAIARRIGDERGVALMYNHLGQVALAQGHWGEAAAWLDESIRCSVQGQWTVTEGYARKDRAVVHLELDELAAAEAQAYKAEELFKAVGFAEGMAHVNRVWGRVRQAQGRFAEAERALRAALTHFDNHNEHAEVARTQLEEAHVLRARGAPTPLIVQALTDALTSAERCHRDALVRAIEEELKAVDEAAHCRHLYRRVRGRGVREDAVALFSGVRETVTVMFLDLQGSTDYVRSNDPEVVIETLNQLMAELVTVLEQHSVTVTQFLGDGFMSLVRGAHHARRAVEAALGLVQTLAEFNRPRKVLNLPLLRSRIGISSGDVFLSNIGTYQKMDFTAVGTTTNLAARLQSEAEPDLPCISRATYTQVQGHFICKEHNPRIVNLKGLGMQEAWDIVGRRI
jgi:class 3 adenylate cyclase/predicted negative regulator of RcsB-dependent stress response